MITYNEQYKDEYPLIQEALNEQTGIIIKAFGSNLTTGQGIRQDLHFQKCFNNKGITSVVIEPGDPNILKKILSVKNF